MIEGDASGDSYSVVLDTEPSALVTVTVSGHSGSDVSVSPTRLTFTTGNWDTAQSVTVTAADDDDGVGDEVTLTHTVAGGDYQGAAADDVTVTVTDDDTPAVTVSPTALAVIEGDAAGGSYTVVLDTEPSALVTVTVGVPAGTDVSASPSSLTFTTGNWDTAQSVTVTAAEDPDAQGDLVTVSHSVAGGEL